MVEQIVTVVVAVLVGLVVLASAFVLGMRAKSPLALIAVRAISRVFNPIQMKSAGKRGAFASIIRHRGRRTGTEYATPVGAVAADGGFVISLPYGTRTQWLRNVLASGSATLVTEGRTYHVDRPQIVSTATVLDCFGPADQRMHRLFGVDECLLLREVMVAPTAVDAALAA